MSLVTVFGGSGFIGRHLIRCLAARGDTVRAAGRDTEAAMFLKTMGGPGQIVPFQADITKSEQAARAVAGANAVVNLVGILSEWGNRTFRRVHAGGAGNVAIAAREAGVGRLVQVSAIGADMNSESEYARSKAAGEAVTLNAYPDATIVRPSVVFGPEDGFFNLFAGLARISPVLPVFGCPVFPKITLFGDGGPVSVDFYGDGGTKFQPVYVGDVANAIQAILLDPETRSRTYELGGPRIYSFKEIMDLVLAETGRRRLLATVPFAVAGIEAWFLEKWPDPLLTRDQVKLLKRDNVVAAGALTLQDLGVGPTAAETILPTYLGRYRRHGSAGLSPA